MSFSLRNVRGNTQSTPYPEAFCTLSNTADSPTLKGNNDLVLLLFSEQTSGSLLEINTARVVLGGMSIFLKKMSPLLSNWSRTKIKPNYQAN